MASTSHIYRRSSGVYAVRLVVPERLRAVVGKREVHASTGSRELPVAKALAAGLLAYWRTKFLDLQRSKLMDFERLVAGTPALLASETLSLSEASHASGIEERELLRLAVEGRLSLYFRPNGLDGHFIPFEDLELDSWESDIYDVPGPNQMPQSALSATAPPLLALRQSKAMASLYLSTSKADIVLFAVPGRNDVAFAPGKVTLERSQLEVSTQELEAARVWLASKVTPDQMALAKSRPRFDIEKSGKGVRLLSEAIDAFMAERSKRCKDDQARRIRGALDLFVELMGDRSLNEVDRDLIKEFRDQKLNQVPAKENKIRLTKGTKNVTESIAAVKGSNWPLITVSEQSKRIKWLEQLFQWLFDEQWLKINLAAGVETGGAYSKKKSPKRAQDARAVFSVEEIKQLFEFSWFKTGRGELTKQGTFREFQPRNYWLPLLGLYTGARIQELCQIRLNDIQCYEPGVWYLNINDLGEDGQSSHEKSLKNVASIRRVPLHPHLIDLGILEWQKYLADKGYTRFFPELLQDEVKGFGKGSTKWFSNLLSSKCGWERDGTRTFHSFRHTFITSCMNLHKLQPHMLAQITGHSRGSSVLSATYTKDMTPTELLKLIEGIDFGLKNVVAPFDCDAGMKALEHALSRKRSPCD